MAFRRLAQSARHSRSLAFGVIRLRRHYALLSLGMEHGAWGRGSEEDGG
jgi:hypothetical protein